MRVHGESFRTVWWEHDAVRIIDQRLLPWRFELMTLHHCGAVGEAIRDMAVRGAGCIGATAGYGMVLAAREAARSADPSATLQTLAEVLNSRPTAVNLRHALRRQLATLQPLPPAAWEAAALREAQAIADEDAAACRAIGEHGLQILRELAALHPQRPVQILTHCNAGWLAFVDHGSATAPIYAAHDAGIPVHVWVDETRPRNQGARLTAWELASHGVPHTLICDNAGGHLMQRGQVDLVITGADRVTRAGDVANKIGTYLKALAARDNGVPFYVTLPSTTLDWEIADGLADIPIEERDADEVLRLDGPACDSDSCAATSILLAAPPTGAANPAFDVTPARLVTALITERGRCAAEEAAIRALHRSNSPAVLPR